MWEICVDLSNFLGVEGFPTFSPLHCSPLLPSPPHFQLNFRYYSLRTKYIKAPPHFNCNAPLINFKREQSSSKEQLLLRSSQLIKDCNWGIIFLDPFYSFTLSQIDFPGLRLCDDKGVRSIMQDYIKGRVNIHCAVSHFKFHQQFLIQTSQNLR